MGQVLSVSRLSKTFEVRKTALSIRKDVIKAVDQVSFSLEQGSTLGLVGESGSGKSTLARCLLLLERPDEGAIEIKGRNICTMTARELRDIRKDLQIIFQDPYASLNPRKNIFQAIAEPLVFHNIVSRRELNEKAMDVLRDVGLNKDFLQKFPHEMSGGQRQRVAIGRALATSPTLLVADEPVSSLDVSIQAQIINLFVDIKEQSGISMIFISHDLNIVKFISDQIIVMYMGRVVEAGDKEEVFLRPLHPYTKMLIAASQGHFCILEDGDGSIPEASCPYYPRCTIREPRCVLEMPELVGRPKHMAACFQTIC